MNRDLSLLDANLARTREGLRVLEDSARFVLQSSIIARELKIARHSLRALEANLGGSVLLVGRKGGEEEPGHTTDSENQRQNLLGLIRANSSRVGEALRSLEEFCKIYAPDEISTVSKLRYKIYQIELDLVRLTPHWWLEWYNVAGFIYPINSDPYELIKLIKHGARVVQLRDKNCSKGEYAKKLETLLNFTSQFNRGNDSEKVLVFVNDYAEIARDYPVAGLHLGQTDSQIKIARKIIGSNKIIGRSNNNLEQLQNSIILGADYLSFGPIFPTPNKPDRTPTGLKNLSSAVTLAPVTLVAIGGINKSNINQVYETGVKNVAIIRSAEEFF